MQHFKLRTERRPHQEEARRRLQVRPTTPSDLDVFSYQMEMGTGKSFCLLDEWQDGVATGLWKHLLLVAPAGSVRNWYADRGEEQRSEMQKHLDPTLLKKTAVVAWGEQSKRKTRDLLERALRDGKFTALFVNVEALSTKTGARDLCELLLQAGDCVMAIDESTTVKGDSKRTRAVVALGKLAVARRLMTGLATPRSPLDLYWQFYFLDWRILGQASPIGFRNRYAITRKTDFGGKLKRKKMVNGKLVMVPHVIEVVVGYRNQEDLARRVAPYSYRVLKEDCLDLEPKIYEMRDVTLTEKQRVMYHDLKEFCTAQLDEQRHVTATSALTVLVRLHQLLCGHLVDDETKGVIDVPSHRVEAVLEVLAEHPRKAVIWTCYVRELHKITKALREEYGPRSVAQFWGGNRSTRGDDEKRFLSDPECRFMVATQSAGGRGNTWTVADLVIYAANSYDLEHRLQSEDRCHRIGQKRTVTYVDLIAPGTLEEKIVRALRRKLDLASLISGEGYRDWLI